MSPCFRKGPRLPLPALALLALLSPTAGWAQAEPELLVPGQTTALADDASATRRTPAGLVFLEGQELRVIMLRTAAGEAGEAWSTGVHWGWNPGGVATGLSVEWLRGPGVPDLRRTRLAFALGDRGLGLGGSANWYASTRDEALDRALTFDLGVSHRPTRWLAWAFTARDLGAEIRPTELVLGLGLRVLGDRLILGVDEVWGPGQNPFAGEGRLELGLRGRVLDGVRLLAGASWPLDGGDPALRLGLALDFAHLGLEGAVPPASWEGGPDGMVGLRISSARYPGLASTPGWALLDLDEQLEPSRGDLFSRGPRLPFIELLRLLDQTRRDPGIEGVVLRHRGAGLSFPQAEALRQAVRSLRQDGKRVAFYFDGVDDAGWYAAAEADRILASPAAIFAVNGLTSTSTYLGEGLAKIGVNAEFARVGDYKNSPDQFTRRDMSEAEREVRESIIDDVFERYVNAMAEGRGLDREKLQAIFSLGLFDAGTAKAHGVVDEVVFVDQLERSVAEGRVRLVERYEDRRYALRPWGPSPVIAVVPVVGTILPGETPTGPFAGEVAGAETVVREIERAAANPAIAAILVRIDSPGGSAEASDRIWRALRQADEAKPVIASMGGVAASGGYYVAAGAQHIVAEPSTITGSIGIFAGHVDLSGLYDKLGVHLETLLRGEHADLLGTGHPWTEDERARMQAFVEAGYQLFLSRVAATRPLSEAEVDALGRGRVWTGAQAQARKLVDEVGTFHDAVEYAKSRAGIAPGTVVDLMVVSQGLPALTAFGGRGGPLRSELPAPLGRILAEYRILLELLADPAPLALMPERVEVR